MSRSRLLWFSLGFVSTYGVFSQCVLKELLVERLALSSQMERDFRFLEARISNIESSSSIPTSPPDQVEG